MPLGKIRARDGRQFVLSDPAAVIRARAAGGVDLPVDHAHQADSPKARANGPVPAAGWIKALASRSDGIWGQVAWTATAAAMIAARDYRCLSPSLIFGTRTGEVVGLNGAGLVHHPALELTALAQQEHPMQPNPNAADPNAADTAQAGQSDLAGAIIALFNLPPDTPDADLVTTLQDMANRLKAPPDPAKYMPVAAVQGMLVDQRTERSNLSAGRAQGKVDAASLQGYIHNGMRDWALELCATDEAAFDTFLEKSGPVFRSLLKTTHTAQAFGTKPADRAQGEVEAAICAQLGLPAGSLSR